MILMKFGGSVLNQKIGFDRMKAILQYNKNEKILIIISAFANSSKLLKNIAVTAENDNLEESLRQVDDFFKRQMNFIYQIINNEQNTKFLKTLFSNLEFELKNLVNGINITRELTKRTLDLILSFGEKIALQVSKCFLAENGFNVAAVDSTELIISDDNFGEAKPIIKNTKTNIDKILLPIFSDYDFILTQGFVAKTITGEITTMGFESSNLTAVLLAHLTGIKEITIWMDVEGIRNADPKIFDSTVLIKNMSYQQARIAALSGLKIIFPEMVTIAENDKIIIKFCSAFSNMDLTTYISEEKEDLDNVSNIIIIKDHLKLYRLSNKDSVAKNYQDKNNVYYDSFDAEENILIDSRRKHILKNVIEPIGKYQIASILNFSNNNNLLKLKEIISSIDESDDIILNYNKNIIKIIYPEILKTKYLSLLHTFL